MSYLRMVNRLTALAVVTLVGAGACAFDSRRDEAGSVVRPVSAADQVTGASASPGPDQSASPSPSPTAAASKTPSPTATTRKPDHGCPQGERQREVEAYLAKLGGFGTITVDGKQSAADCAAIKKFQKRYDIRPPKGRAGPLTYDVAKRLAGTRTSRCDAGKGLTFCVDLTRQTVWAMRDGKVVMKPTVTRTGMAGYATPAGSYTINFRNRKEWSNPYEVWLPYWQRFVGGIGFHQTTTYLHIKSIGSHGCVNLLPVDARQMWNVGRVGTRVHVFGRRPGT